MGEGYVIMIVASIPPMNCLVKLGKQIIMQQSSGSSDHFHNQATIKQSWTAEHEDPTVIHAHCQQV
jgi:hypothetical protein